MHPQFVKACKTGNLNHIKHIVEQYLNEDFQFIDVQIEINNACRIAAENGHLETVKYLIEHGADIHVYNNLALKCAIENDHLEVIKYLVEKGAIYNVNMIKDIIQLGESNPTLDIYLFESFNVPMNSNLLFCTLMHGFIGNDPFGKINIKDDPLFDSNIGFIVSRFVW